MARNNTAFLLVLLAAAALAAACGPDRFTDAGCDTDADCRGDRVCAEGLCVAEDRAPDAGDDDGGRTDADDGDSGTLDIGTEEDAGDVEVDAFLGEWTLEGPVTVTDESGAVLQETEPQPLLARIREGEQSDLVIDIESLEECTILADVTGPNTFEVQPLDCESSPVGQIQGDATITGGTGRLSQEGEMLEFNLSVQLESMDFGVVILEITARGPRLAP